MSKTATNQTAKLEAMEKLRKWFPKGSTVFTIRRNISRTGMSQDIGIVCLTADADGITDWHPNHAVATVLGLRTPRRDSVRINGGGMDMGFDIVYNLSRVLYKEDCALKHRWL